MMPLGEAFYRGRVRAIQTALAEADLKGILLLDAPNVIYASGFSHIASERPIGCYVPRTGAPTLFVPLLELENAAENWIGDIRHYFEFPGQTHPVAWMLHEIGQGRIAIDSLSHGLARQLDRDIVSSDLVNRLRWIKQPEELLRIEEAAHYADFCLECVLAEAGDIISAGGTELDIIRHCLGKTLTKMKDEIGEQFMLRGAAAVGTVHSGPRAALPHGTPIARIPQPGEPLIAGIGASVAGYHAESGATFVVGDADDKLMRALHAADDCRLAATAALQVGATCASVNAAALQVLKDAGYGTFIRHRIGHGMGIEGHEAPWLAPGDDTILQANMVFSNEPGIYRPGRDGIRLIDSMIVCEGCAHVPSRFLTEHPPEARILPR